MLRSNVLACKPLVKMMQILGRSKNQMYVIRLRRENRLVTVHFAPQ